MNDTKLGKVKAENDNLKQDISVLQAQLHMAGDAIRDLAQLLIDWSFDEELDDLNHKLTMAKALTL